MLTKPLVSVVIPAYNTAGTIRESIDSVLAQTYQHYEIIVVDDGSPDHVAEVVKKTYGKKVKLIQQSNQGLAGARNTGIANSVGEYVAFLDSDDTWLPHKLELQVAQATQFPDGDVFYTDCYFWEGGKRSGLWTDLHQQKSGDITADLIQRTVMIPVLTVLARKAALTTAEGFDESLRQIEDYDLWLRLSMAGHKFYFLERPLAQYRINPQGLSRNTLLMAETQLRVYQKGIGIANSKLEPLLKRQITIFTLEVLHQRRKPAIIHNRRLQSARLTLSMLPLRPTHTPQLLLTTAILLMQPSWLAAKLA